MMAADILDDLTNELNKGAEIVTKKIKEYSEETRIRINILTLKKDKYLALKELGERTYDLLSQKQNVAQDLKIKDSMSKLEKIDNKISALENELKKQ
jgi:hypothetical protein